MGVVTTWLRFSSFFSVIKLDGNFEPVEGEELRLKLTIPNSYTDIQWYFDQKSPCFRSYIGESDVPSQAFTHLGKARYCPNGSCDYKKKEQVQRKRKLV